MHAQAKERFLSPRPRRGLWYLGQVNSYAEHHGYTRVDAGFTLHPGYCKTKRKIQSLLPNALRLNEVDIVIHLPNAKLTYHWAIRDIQAKHLPAAEGAALNI